MRNKTCLHTALQRLRLPLVTCAVFSVATLSVSAQAYQVIDLGMDVSPTDINFDGTIVGSMSGGQYITKAFIYSMTDGMLRDIASGAGGAVALSAQAINDTGDVVGISDTGAYTAVTGTLQQNWDNQGAWGISSTGSIAGNQAGVNPYRATTLPYNPAVYDGNSWTVMDIARLYSRGSRKGVYADVYQLLDINDAGYAVGKKSRTGLTGSAALLIKPPYTAVQSVSDVVFLPTQNGGVATAINNQNQIVGTSGENPSLGNYAQAFLYDADAGSLTDLGTLMNANGEYGLRSSAADINDQGQVVGSSWMLSQYTSLINATDYHAFIWENGIMRDLNDLIPAGSGWVLTAATAINERGEIVGSGQLNGEKHGFVLIADGVAAPVAATPAVQNLPPVAIADADITRGKAPLSVNFTAAASYDPEGQALSYAWDFGDGSQSTAQNPTHLFTTAGVYPVSLSVTDTRGLSATVQLTITVGKGKG